MPALSPRPARRWCRDGRNISPRALARLVLILTLHGARLGAAQTAGKAGAVEGPPPAVRRLNAEAEAALSAGRLGQARQKLEQAYIAWPSLEGIYSLGQLAAAQGHAVAAADLYRRYLAAAGREVEESRKAALLRHIASLKEPTSEVDVVSGDAGAFLRLDGELVGVLPLARPLLVSAGEHRFALEKDGRQFQTSAQSLPAGQRAQLQVALESRYAVLTLTPAVILLFEPPSLDEGVQAQLMAAVAQAAQQERSFLVDREQTSLALSKTRASGRGVCAADLQCQESLAQQVDATAVLIIKAAAAESRLSMLAVQLLDIPTGVVVGKEDAGCSACSLSEARAAILRLTRKLLQDAATRGRGTLQVSSEVPGAKVVVDGRELGSVPFTHEAFEGPHEVEVTRAGYLPYKTTAQVVRGQTAVVAASSQKSAVATPQPGRAPAGRPRWRLVVGGVTLGAGLVLLGFGASALAAQGTCVDAVIAPAELCDNLYATSGVGGALLGTGAALAVGGIVLLAWPGK